MTNGNNGMTTIEVEVLLAFCIPDIGPLGFYWGDVINRVYVDWFHQLILFKSDSINIPNRLKIRFKNNNSPSFTGELRIL